LFGRYDRGIRVERSQLFPYRRVIYTQSAGEDAPLSDRGIRALRVLTVLLAFPVGYVVYLAVKSVA
jgi:hypothetical protein